MKKHLSILIIITLFLISNQLKAQINEQNVGAWYMYFFDTSFKESSWGAQGDIQYRNWNIAGDLEQLLIRGGITYKPKDSNLKLTIGYGNITTGTYGSNDDTTKESRIYQEVLFPTKIGKRLYTKHRFRYEQRFVDNQDFRTRYRYNLFLNIPLNNQTIDSKTVYFALYNELFINGERNIGNNNVVEIFDRNRFYFGTGYMINKKFKVQLGIMNQTTNNWNKNQLQFSLHHNI